MTAPRYLPHSERMMLEMNAYIHGVREKADDANVHAVTGSQIIKAGEEILLLRLARHAKHGAKERRQSGLRENPPSPRKAVDCQWPDFQGEFWQYDQDGDMDTSEF
ncbi:hypothetical protein PAXINDRAFT_104003 [Paxillus involutus ATCC 200175]|uniref:Uncharacterized protein n=1 Tax=Paxillus involutus ATCC 200175 TaxID=664439 RepID=A0A0C9SLQ6_PAXIN|nr:hypothetical protein PAXINDRAFT_104003 [Paxillus involutus ATCC 200175]